MEINIKITYKNRNIQINIIINNNNIDTFILCPIMFVNIVRIYIQNNSCF